MALLSDLLQRDRSSVLSQRLMGLMSLLQPQTTGVGAPSSGTTPSGQTVTGGPTQYDYQTWPFPFGGLDPSSQLLETRRGISLQSGPMQSLIDIARASDLMPGTREIGMIGQGYRSPQQQRTAAATNPNAADYGYSYHPEGLAIDAGLWSSNPQLAAALSAAGWNQLPSESWHWDYGVNG